MRTQVMEKCKKAMTDFTSAVTYEPEARPAVANLIRLHSLCTGLDPQVTCAANNFKLQNKKRSVVPSLPSLKSLEDTELSIHFLTFPCFCHHSFSFFS